MQKTSFCLRGLLGFFFSALCHANINGNGSASVGVSADNEEFGAGLRADYLLNSEFFRQQFDWSFHAERNSNTDRPTPITGHYYEFERSYYVTSMNHRLDFSNPFIHWTTDARVRRLSTDGTTEPTTSWGVGTGPTYERWLRPDINVRASAFFARDLINDRFSKTVSSGLSLGKRLTGRTQLDIGFNRNCTRFEDDLFPNECEREAGIQIQGDYYDLDYAIRRGWSLYADETIPVYDLSLTYHFNQSSTFILDYTNRRLRNQTDIAPDIDAPLVTGTYVINRSFSYHFDYGRNKAQIEFIDVRQDENAPTSTTTSEPFYQKSGIAFYSYRLESPRCMSCTVLTEYEYSKDSIRANWRAATLGMEVPLLGRWSYEFNVKRTAHDDLPTMNSINLLLHFNGRSAERQSRLQR